MQLKKSQKYNGWENYETWNVALWIQNDEFLYHCAKRFRDYNGFRNCISEVTGGTPDSISWYHTNLDIKELDRLIQSL